jgi:hypothetical protein
MAEMIAQLLATDAARVKLGARDISTAEAEQLPRNRHATTRNPHAGGQEGDRLLHWPHRWRPNAHPRP